MQGLRNRKQGPGGTASHEQRMSTDDTDDDDSSPPDKAAKPPTHKLKKVALDTKSDTNNAGTDKGKGSEDDKTQEAAFDVSAIKGKLAKRPASGGRPRKGPDAKSKVEKDKDKDKDKAGAKGKHGKVQIVSLRNR